MSSQKLLDAFGPEERTPKYGSSNASISSLSSQSSEEAISLKVATRKKKRLERHHKSRPKLKSTLSKIVHSTQVSEEEDNVIEIPNNNMVISELDQNAEEVKSCLTENLSEWSRTKVNLSTIREKYRYNRLMSQNGIHNLYRFVTDAKAMLVTKQSIVVFVYTDLLVDLTFCLAYLVEMKQEADIHAEPPWMFKWRSYDLWFLCICLSLWNLFSFVMRMVLTGRPFSVFISFRSLIEIATTYPFLFSLFIQNGQYLYVPYFLRSWVLLLRIKSVIKIKTNLLMTDKLVDPLKSKLVYLIGTLIALLYNGMSAFQYCEVTFGEVHYSILDSLYVVMVTLSTVGYGDITPSTEGSRVIMMLLIVISLAALPSLLADVLNTVRKRSDWGGWVDDSALPFILIIGTFRPEQVVEILDGFLNSENIESHLNVIFLDINRPNEELKFLERNSMWGHRIQVLHGSVLDEDTLKRVKARSANAIFTLSDQHAPDPHKEDERNTVRLWSLHCHTVVHNVPIYTYNLAPSTAIYQKMATEIICVREFKQYLLAMNCRCRGASTLLTNLLHQRKPLDHYDESWQAQYDDGSCNEIYIDKTPKALIGLPFKYAAWITFTECQVIMFAVKTNTDQPENSQVLLSPVDYHLQENDLCVYICESPREVDDVNELDAVIAAEKLQGKLKQREYQARDGLGLFTLSSRAPITHSSAPASPLHRPLKHSISNESNKSIASLQPTKLHTNNKHFQISKLPSPRMALLTGSRKLISKLGQPPKVLDNEDGIPLCYLLDKPLKIQDMTIEHTDNMYGHIVVCMHHKVSNIFKFIYSLRLPHLEQNELQDIVFLCTSQPKQKTLDLVNRFPRVHFMVGDCQHPEDLLRAGVKRAKQVVVMSESECLDQRQRSSDSPAIMTSHLLDLLLSSKSNDSSRIVNLVEKSNIRFMHLLQGKDVAEEVDVFYTPAYAAGSVMVDSLLSNVLLSQTYYKSDIVTILKALCGMPGPLYDKHSKLKKEFKHLHLVPVPLPFVGKSYLALFESFLLDHEATCLGLYRAPEEQMGNELPFVYTNPVSSLLLKKTDRIYLLASPGWFY